MELKSKVFEVRVREPIYFKVDHWAVIDRFKMRLKDTWLYMHENKAGVKIDHMVFINNQEIMFLGDLVIFESDSLEDILSYYSIRNKVIGITPDK